MELKEAIRKRRSIRKFLDKPVSWDKISKIIDSARYAPSAGNVQDWRFVVVTDEDKIAKLSDAALGQRFVEHAPVVIVVCADLEKIRRAYGIRGEKLYSIQSCAAAIQNMLLTATDLGLGSCWTSAFDEENVKSILSIPDTARPQAILPIGYADEQPSMAPRAELTHIVFFEKYGNWVKDIDAVLQNWGRVMQRDIKKGAKDVGKKVKKVIKKVKERLKKKK